MIALPTASRLERADACPASVVLPQVDAETTAASIGIAIHSFLERVAEVGRDAALELVPPNARRFAEAIPLDRLPVAGECFAAEVAFAYDPDTDRGRELGRSIGRSYVLAGLDPEREFGATVDVVGLGSDLVYVADWKTGRGPVTSPPANLQLRAGALAAARAYGVGGALVQVVHLDDDGSVWLDPREPAALDAFDLDATRTQLEVLAVRIRTAADELAAGRLPNVRVGRHCAGCRAVAMCPAAGLAVRAIVVAASGAAPLTPDVVAEGLTPGTALDFLGRIDAVKHALDVAEEGLRIYARANPIDLGDGKVWGPRTLTRETVDASTVYDVIRREAGEEAARGAVEWKSSKTAIEDVARDLVARRKAAGEKRVSIKGETSRLVDEVRSRGGIRASTFERFDAYRPEVSK